MAVNTTVAAAVLRVAQALAKYAKDQGWGPEDWQIYYRVSAEWDRMHFIFVARAFDQMKELAAYSDVRSFLENELADEPELFRSIGLVVRGLKQVEEGGIYRIGEDFQRIFDEHL